jgi:hypothetical protein
MEAGRDARACGGDAEEAQMDAEAYTVWLS